ncbi:hypothetical protein PFISCL1PPCAC_2142, partial [Pristionchus fissidentatus]
LSLRGHFKRGTGYCRRGVIDASSEERITTQSSSSDVEVASCLATASQKVRSVRRELRKIRRSHL